MGSSKILSDQLRQLIFSELYQRYSEPKARRKALAILENALALLDKKGFENVTFLMIARESAMTPPSLRHYFSNIEEIQLCAIKYISLTVQRLVIDQLSSSTDPREMLKRYIQGHATWARHFKTHIRVWLGFLSYCSRKKKYREMNTQSVLNGAERLARLLATGRTAQAFHHTDDLKAARAIQMLMLGWLTALVTEESETQYTEDIIEQSYRLLSAT